MQTTLEGKQILPPTSLHTNNLCSRGATSHELGTILFKAILAKLAIVFQWPKEQTKIGYPVLLFCEKHTLLHVGILFEVECRDHMGPSIMFSIYLVSASMIQLCILYWNQSSSAESFPDHKITNAIQMFFGSFHLSSLFT